MEAAYFAGLFDGEGWVRVDIWQKPNSPYTRYQVVAGLGVTYRPVTEALKARYGGSLLMNRHDLRNPKNRIQFSWRVCSRIAQVFLMEIHPHLHIKKEQVDLALKLQDHIDYYKMRGGRSFPLGERDRILSERADIASRMKALKKQSFLPTLLSLSTVAPVN
jgi:hypothetical protein